MEKAQQEKFVDLDQYDIFFKEQNERLKNINSSQNLVAATQTCIYNISFLMKKLNK